MPEHFWDSMDTVPAGLGFDTLGAVHLAWLAAAAAAAVTASLLYRRADGEGRRRARLVIALLILAEELFKIAALIFTKSFEPWYLPLHFCSVSMFVILAHAIRPGRIKEQLLYCGGLPGALMALIFPNWIELPLLNYMHIQSFTIHILLVVYPVMLLSAGEIRPNPRLLPKCAAILAACCVIIYPVNKLLDSNYFFLNSPGTGNPLVWFYQRLGSPGYFLVGMPVLAGLLWTLLYAAAVIRQSRRRRI